MVLEDALNDLKARIKAYEEVYETVEDDEGFSYIKVIDLANKMICFQIWGSIPLRTVQLLMSCHIGTRPVYLVRSGQCADIDDLSVIDPILSSLAQTTPMNTAPLVDNSNSPYSDSGNNNSDNNNNNNINNNTSQPSQLSQLSQTHQSIINSLKQARMPSALTCNSLLNDEGRAFSRRLGNFITNELNLYSTNTSPRSLQHPSNPNAPPIRVISSTLPRAIETTSCLPCPSQFIQQRSALGILDTGIYHGMTVESIKSKYPEEYLQWKENPFIYRFSGGESLLDMNRRLADIVLEIERHHEPVVIVSHLSPVQSLIAYFMNRDPKEIPLISVPQHSVVKLVPSIYGWSMEVISLAASQSSP